MPNCILCFKDAESRCILCTSPLCEEHVFLPHLHKQKCSTVYLKQFANTVAKQGLNDKTSHAYQHLQTQYNEWIHVATEFMQGSCHGNKIDTLFRALYLSSVIFGCSNPIPQNTATTLLVLLADESANSTIDTEMTANVLNQLADYPLNMTPKIRYLYNLLTLCSKNATHKLKVLSVDRYSTIRRNINQAVFLFLKGETHSSLALLKSLLHSDCSSIEMMTLRYVWHCMQSNNENRQNIFFLVTEQNIQQVFPRQYTDESLITFFISTLLYFSYYSNSSNCSVKTINEKMLIVRGMLRDIMHILNDNITLNSCMLAAIYIRVLVVLIETSPSNILVSEYTQEANNIYTKFLLPSRAIITSKQTVEECSSPLDQDLTMDDLSITTSMCKRVHHRLIFFPDDTSPPMLVTTVQKNPCVQAGIAFNITKVITSIRKLASEQHKDKQLTRRVATSFVDQRILPLHYRSTKPNTIKQAQTSSLPISANDLQKASMCHEYFNVSRSKGVMEARLRVHEVLTDMRQSHKECAKLCHRPNNAIFMVKDIDLDLLEKRLNHSTIKNFIKNPGDCYIETLTKKVSTPYSKESLHKFSQDITHNKLTKDFDKLISESICAMSTLITEKGTSIERYSSESNESIPRVYNMTIQDCTSDEDVGKLLAATANVIGELNAYVCDELNTDCVQI